MSTVTYFVVQPVQLSQRGRYTLGSPIPAQDRHQAVRRAERLAKEIGGAIAFSRTGDPEIGEFDDAIVIGQFGELPDDLMLNV